MKTIYYKLTIIILILSLYSCEKEEKPESNKPKTYMDHDNFIMEGLVAYYPFNGNTNDESKNKLNGKGNNLLFTSDRFNKEDGACYFNGVNSHVKIENSPLLNSTTYTICFWYKADLKESSRQAILSKSDTSRYGYSIDMYNSEHYSNLGFAYKDKQTQFEKWALFGPGARGWSLGDERKYEFAVVAFSEKNFVNYLGGQAVSFTPSNFFNSNEFDLYIGKSENGRYKNFKGELDDLLIYNRILTSEEVEKLYKWKKAQ